MQMQMQLQKILMQQLDRQYNKSSLSGFKNFADNLTTNNEKSMVIENVNIENVNESEISGSMTLNMYVLKKLADPSAS